MTDRTYITKEDFETWISMVNGKFCTVSGSKFRVIIQMGKNDPRKIEANTITLTGTLIEKIGNEKFYGRENHWNMVSVPTDSSEAYTGKKNDPTRYFETIHALLTGE